MTDLADPDRRELLLGRRLASRRPDVEAHISSLIVHVRPEYAAATTYDIARLPGVEIHPNDPSGKLVVTLETQGEFEIVQCLGAIQELPGVLSAALVFHHCESDPS